MDTVKNADDKPFSLKQGTKNHATERSQIQ